MYDLHLHSTYSDGDFSPVALLQAARQRHVTGVSLTDHNGLWGIAEAHGGAKVLGLGFVAGIEVSSLYHGADVHILGYGRAFQEDVITQGLASTRQGYAARIQGMVARCQAAGYGQVTFEHIVAARQPQADPCYVSYDVAKELVGAHEVSRDEARRLTVKGGACYVPYGSWALSPAAAVSLLHQANALAILAHPGTIAHESGESMLKRLLVELVNSGFDGIEVYHPFHSPVFTRQLETFVADHRLLATGGSDWHGPHRFHDTDFGKIGLTDQPFAAVLNRLP